MYVLTAEDRANDLADAYANRPVTEPGAYERNGTVYIVKWNRERTRLYAKRLVRRDNRASLEYVAGAIYELRAADAMTLERGREISAQIGACCVCARTLTDPRSVARGIGPVCGRAFIAAAATTKVAA